MTPADFSPGYCLLILGIIVAYIVVFGFIAYTDDQNAKREDKETYHD